MRVGRPVRDLVPSQNTAPLRQLHEVWLKLNPTVSRSRGQEGLVTRKLGAT